MKTVALLLARAGTEDVNCNVGPRDLRTPLHLASALGNLALVQLLIWVKKKRNTHLPALPHTPKILLEILLEKLS